MNHPRLILVPGPIHIRLNASKTLLLVLACLLISVPSYSRSKKTLKAPDVLILIISGLGSGDQVAVNYSTKIPKAEAIADVANIKKESGWLVQNITVTTKSANTPSGKPSTTAMFQTPGIVDRPNGLLPLSAFVTALKKYETIQVNYLIMGEFLFKGLKEFDNQYVKISLNRSGNSYLYNIRIKDRGFEHINVPLVQPKHEQPVQRQMSTGARVMIILLIAIACSFIAYFIAVHISRRGR